MKSMNLSLLPLLRMTRRRTAAAEGEVLEGEVGGGVVGTAAAEGKVVMN